MCNTSENLINGTLPPVIHPPIFEVVNGEVVVSSRNTTTGKAIDYLLDEAVIDFSDIPFVELDHEELQSYDVLDEDYDDEAMGKIAVIPFESVPSVRAALLHLMILKETRYREWPLMRSSIVEGRTVHEYVRTPENKYPINYAQVLGQMIVELSDVIDKKKIVPSIAAAEAGALQ